MKMKRSALNYLLLITLLLVSSCASKTYEWVKINPDKIIQAKSAKSYSENINYVEVLVNAKYKAERIVYVENSTDYFSAQNSKPSVKPHKGIVKNNQALKISNHVKLTSTPKIKTRPLTQGKVINQPIAKSNIPVNNKLTSVSVEEAAAMSKLNSGLKMPKKKKLPKDISLSERTNKYERHKPLSDNDIREEGARRNSYLWLGLVLLIVGLIIGLIFGGFAYFISVVGLVFLVIGYFPPV